jgi:lysophospholipase L1-like esterase
MRNRLEHVTRMNPTTVFFMGGIVDLLNGRSFQDIRIDVRAILDTIISSGSNTIVHSTLPVCYPDNCSNRKYPPDYINASVGELNTMLADQCSALGIDYVDLHPHMTTRGRLRTEFTMDGIHLNMAGYTVWRDVLVHQYGPRLEALG